MKANRRNFIKRMKKRKEDALEYTVEHYLPVVKMIGERSLRSRHGHRLE